MPQEKSAGAIIFHRADSKIKYLLLRYLKESTGQPGYWGFAKGKIEPNEDLKSTVSREIEEETGLCNLKFIDDFQIRDEYFFKRKNEAGAHVTIHKEVVYYLVQSQADAVTISPEHCDYAWLESREARQQLTHESMKKMLDKANKALNF